MESEKKKQNTRHFIFAVFWIVKACILYVFCDEFAKLSMRPELGNIELFGVLKIRTFWLTAACLIGLGVLLDLAMLVASMFNRRVTIGILALSFFVHTVVIVPQNVAGFYMAVSLNRNYDQVKLDWEKDFGKIQKICDQRDNTKQGISEYTESLAKKLRAAVKGVDEVQRRLGCCGWNNKEDWNNKMYCGDVKVKAVKDVKETTAKPATSPLDASTNDQVSWWSKSNRNGPDSCCQRHINFEIDMKPDETCDTKKERWSKDGCRDVAKGLIQRVLMVFSVIIICVELIYFFISILFYVFLVWKPFPKVDSKTHFKDLGSGSIHEKAASPSNTFRASSKGSMHKKDVFSSEKEDTQKTNRTATQKSVDK